MGIRHNIFEEWLNANFGGDVEILMGALADERKFAANLAMGIRMLKAYPRSRDKRIDELLEYCRDHGHGGSPLREEKESAQ